MATLYGPRLYRVPLDWRSTESQPAWLVCGLSKSGAPMPAAMQRLVSPGAPLCHLSSPGMSLFARYEAGRARNGWRLSLYRAQLLIVALLIADATIIGLRAQLTWLMPQTASFYSAFGLPVDLDALRFDDVAAVAERRDAKPVLVVNGKISNSRTRTETVPRLRFAVRDAGHQEFFSWSAAPARDNLGARETIQFRSELALPPPDTRDVVVRFEHDDGL